MTRTQRAATATQRTQTVAAAFVSFVLACSALVSLSAVDGPVSAVDGNWPYHDHDAGGSRFSPLKQITPANAGTLQLAWTFDTGVSGLQVTPLVINGIMYVTAGEDVIALEPETAKGNWGYTGPATVSPRGVGHRPRRPGTPPRPF